jgi:hypothetical protein
VAIRSYRLFDGIRVLIVSAGRLAVGAGWIFAESATWIFIFTSEEDVWAPAKQLGGQPCAR